MRYPIRYVATVTLARLTGCCPVAAQNSTQSPPPRANAIGGDAPAGDPNGAVRALGGAEENDGGRKPSVTVPKLGGEGPNKTGGLPAGTR